jgi:hypothetical protein
MVLAVNILKEKQYSKAIKNGVNTIIYNQLDFNLQRNDKIRFVDSNINRVPSSWYLWEKNNEKIIAFKAKFPDLFKIGKYDITLAIQKAVYWSNFRTSFINYTIEKDFKNEQIYYLEDLYQHNKSKVLIKYFKEILSFKNQINEINHAKTKAYKVGILIHDIFQLSIYKNILYKIVNDDNFVVFVDSNTVKKAVIELGVSAANIVVVGITDFSGKFPIIDISKLKDTDWYILYQILNEWQHLHKLINECECYVKSGIYKLLINEGENGVAGAIAGEVMKKNEVLTYNTMNGMKSGEAQDAFISFDYWFVWDTKMKDFLVKKNKLPEHMLLVSGHLMEDEVSHYRDKLFTDRRTDKKVISFFSVSGKRQTKIISFEYLYQLAEHNPNIQLLIRKHPSEKEEDLVVPEGKLENVKFVEYNSLNSKETLYEQLSISHLSICFGSTVAIESKWFGVPCITFEKRDESLIYLKDNETIFHVKDLDQFIIKFNELLGKAKTEKPELNKVADYIIETLLH